MDRLGFDERENKYRVELDRCARAYISDSSWLLLDLYDLYRMFHLLPTNDNLVDQDAEVIDAFRIFETEFQIMMPGHPLTASQLVKILESMNL